MDDTSALPTPIGSDRVVVTVALLLIGLLAIQPLFVERDPNRQVLFAWEMYSKGAPLEEFELVGPDETRRLGVLDVQPRGHAEVDYGSALPPFICAMDVGLEEVRVFRGGSLSFVHSCSP